MTNEKPPFLITETGGLEKLLLQMWLTGVQTETRVCVKRFSEIASPHYSPLAL